MGFDKTPTETLPEVATHSVAPEEIVAAARGLCGAPFRHSGRDPESGLDCGGLVQLALQRASCVGEFDYRPFPYPSFEGVRRFLGSAAREISPAAARAGDIGLFKGLRGRPHMGVITDGDPLTMVHATLDGGVVEGPVEAYPIEMIAAFRPAQV
jgi:cell wall-associated NlpC family hydrolase